MLLLGETSYLREMLDAGEGRSASASELLESIGPETSAGETFWLLGSTSGAIPPVLGEANVLPPLQAFSLSGRLDAELVLRARGRAQTAEAAQQLADVLRGLVALGRMNAGNANPELARLAEAVSIELFDQDIELNVSVPYETIRKLSERSRKEAEE